MTFRDFRETGTRYQLFKGSDGTILSDKPTAFDGHGDFSAGWHYRIFEQLGLQILYFVPSNRVMEIKERNFYVSK